MQSRRPKPPTATRKTCTALGPLASGAGLVILQTSTALAVIGYALLITAAIVFAAGCVYGFRAKRRLDGLRERPAL